jgi:threonine synthase
MEKHFEDNPKKGFILGTAHPVKFPQAVEKAIQTSVDLPESLELLMKKEKKSIEINPDFAELKRFLLTEI